jgi:CelD/BcsL family acetyltransferase involved in cellulose biosynthesis
MFQPGQIAPAAEAPLRALAVLRPAARIAELGGEWTALATRAAEPNPYLEHWFVAASLTHLAQGCDIRLIEVRADGRLIGAMPVAIVRGYAHLPVRFVQNWCHHQTFLGTPLIEAGAEAPFWTAALDLLDASDWAGSFLHLRGLVENGPVHRGLGAAARGRGAAIVHREVRAFLASDLSPEAYWERNVRKKKRKELRRRRKRLGELGALVTRTLAEAHEVDAWCDEFLALEAAGWKGEAGSALASREATARFFREAIAGAFAAGRLQFLRLDLDGHAIAMLANFVTPPGSFGFKTAFDESLASYSPGVQLQQDNLRILARPDIAWMDSCAVENHPMIDSLWGERRSIVRVTVRLAGARRGAIFHGCRALERAAAALRRPKSRKTPHNDATEDGE